ncbi:MAG TPA: class I SAM-dependent methyltransferase [Candidatus Saccharimonadales bacterium]|nr:class I SAM-dependent methyltransferase [Candidatus Saccharimonadales bacterium]
MTTELWDAAYAQGFDRDTPPAELVTAKLVPVIKALIEDGTLQDAACLDIGTGAGKNLPPLLEVGFTRIDAVDISRAGLRMAAARLKGIPGEQSVRFWQGDFVHDFAAAVPPAAQYAAALAIHTFHANREATHQGIRQATQYVMPGGVFALCTAAALRKGILAEGNVQVWPDGGYTTYADNGLPVHALAETELRELLEPEMQLVSGLGYREATINEGRTVAEWATIWQALA